MMMRLFQSVIIFGILFSGVSIETMGQSNTLISFSLEDQFDVHYTNAQYRGYYVILVGGDRKGSDYCFIWSDAVKEKLENDPMKKNIKVLGIADLKAAPASFQNFIKSKFPKEKKHWALLDWDGIFSETYKFQEDVANIIIFSPEGDRIYTNTATEVEYSQLEEIVTLIHKHSKTYQQ
jgi:hypothetical protein